MSNIIFIGQLYPKIKKRTTAYTTINVISPMSFKMYFSIAFLLSLVFIFVDPQKNGKNIPCASHTVYPNCLSLDVVYVHLGEAHIDGTLLSSIFLIGHGENLNAKDNAHDTKDGATDTASEERDQYSDDTGLGIALHKAVNTVAVEENGKNTKKNFVIHNKPPLNIL